MATLCAKHFPRLPHSVLINKSTGEVLWVVEHRGHLSSNSPGNWQAGIGGKAGWRQRALSQGLWEQQKGQHGDGLLLSGHPWAWAGAALPSRPRRQGLPLSQGFLTLPPPPPLPEVPADGTREPSGLSFPVGKHSGRVLVLAPADLAMRAACPSF